MQSPLAILYPPQCVSCGEPIADDHGLCGKCWAETPFITGHVCDACGAPLPGESDGAADLCDDCIATARPWSRGRAALIYTGNGRRMVLQIKLSDRLDLVPPAAGWMARAGRELISPDMLVVPIPAHWMRIFARRYNQAAELARALGRKTGLDVAPTALIRPRRTEKQEGMGREGRFANMHDAIRPHPKRGTVLRGRRVLLVDDVMTSGATFAAASEACYAAGAKDVLTLALARTVKDA
ncbi:ComF family protein [Sinisalibacter aestuarii]|uniref:Amidophosphoribosyltransferase n=1 Tax=Sinisalibacter aestuarii TaxID=2949426 RepID=A0ABQ5LN99_9RHOB|nr:ComF family protein [Sinisalibacter aestuarii]GKY86431.1 amidophosphoribosyltransferase [Sinisalibacter aestuarii]